MRPYTSLNSDFKRISPCFMPTNIRFPDDLDLLYATMKKTGELKRLDDDTCSTDRWRRQKLREEANAAKSARDAADPDQKGLPPGFDALAASKKAEAEKKAAAKVGSGSAKKKR